MTTSVRLPPLALAEVKAKLRELGESGRQAQAVIEAAAERAACREQDGAAR